MFQTDRALMGYANGQPPKSFSPLADVSKIEQFARRIAQPVTYESELRKALATQHTIIILEKQIKGLREVPVTYKEGRSTPAKSTTCETKSAPRLAGPP